MFIVFISTGIVAGILILLIVKLFPPASGVNIALTSRNEINSFNNFSQIISTFTVKWFSWIII